MPRYYFDICQRDGWHYDEFGVELNNLTEARDQAISILPDIAREEGWVNDHHEVSCQVRDNTGIVYAGELTFSGRPIERGSY